MACAGNPTRTTDGTRHRTSGSADERACRSPSGLLREIGQTPPWLMGEFGNYAHFSDCPRSYCAGWPEGRSVSWGFGSWAGRDHWTRAAGQPRAGEDPSGWHPGEKLWHLEEGLLASAASGEVLDCGEGPFDLADMQAWSAERTIRAAVLRHLLIDETWPADAKGIRLRGIRITGDLDFEAATLRRPLSLEGCYVDGDEPVRFNGAIAHAICMTGCHIAGLNGDLLAAQALDLSRSTITGPLLLRTANITGQLVCRGAQLAGCDKDDSA